MLTMEHSWPFFSHSSPASESTPSSRRASTGSGGSNSANKSGTAGQVSATAATARARAELYSATRKWQSFKESRRGRFEIRFVAVEKECCEVHEIA